MPPIRRKRGRTKPPAEDGPSLKFLLDKSSAHLPPLNEMSINDRKSTVEYRIGLLESELSYIGTVDPTDNPFAPRYETVDDAADAVEAVLTLLRGEMDTVLEALEVMEELAADKMDIDSKDADEKAGDLNAYMQFINMSLGDCTLLTSPLGARILIDCGNSGAEDDILSPDGATGIIGGPLEFIRQQVNNSKFLDGTKQIDILIYTHPDADHHNKTKDVLGALGITGISMVYYGGTESFDCKAFAKTQAYVRGRCGNDPTKVRKIILREEPNSTVTKTIRDVKPGNAPSSSGSIGTEYIDPVSNDIVLFRETNDKNEEIFKLSILAANATGAFKDTPTGRKFRKTDSAFKSSTEPKTNGTKPNIQSLMIRVEAYGGRYLICGDATAITERVAINQFSALLSEIHILRIGHHGSKTSSSRAFILACAGMKEALASTAGVTKNNYGLPRNTIMSLYNGLIDAADPASPHTVYAWDDENDASNLADITYYLWATGSNGTRYWVESPTHA